MPRRVRRAVGNAARKTNNFLRKTKLISKAGKALTPFAGPYSPHLAAASGIAGAIGYGKGKRKRRVTPRGMKF